MERKLFCQFTKFISVNFFSPVLLYHITFKLKIVLFSDHERIFGKHWICPRQRYSHFLVQAEAQQNDVLIVNRMSSINSQKQTVPR